MDSNLNSEKLNLTDDLSSCPECGYKDGFHVSFKKASKLNQFGIILICPNCHRRFHVNWTVTLK